MDRPKYQDGLPAFAAWARICENGAKLAEAGKIGRRLRAERREPDLGAASAARVLADNASAVDALDRLAEREELELDRGSLQRMIDEPDRHEHELGAMRIVAWADADGCGRVDRLIPYGDEARTEAFHTGKVLVARVLVDLALAAQLGFQRHHGQTVRLLATITTAFAHRRVDEGALGRVF